MRRSRLPRWTAAGLVIVLAGCTASVPAGPPLAAADYAGWSCADLGKEARRLARATTGTHEYLLPSGRKEAEAQRARDKQQLKAVKQAALGGGCGAIG